MIWIGTSGFQYPEWRGKFYPRKLGTAQMLEFYSGHFSTTEINYTFQRIPSPAALRRWAAETPEPFQFSLKAPKLISHQKRLQDVAQVFRHFLTATAKLKEKRGPILIQLPPFFKKDAERLGTFLRDLPRGARVTFEFRHPSWFDDEIFELLRKKNVALCLAESDELSTPVRLTADFAYLRLRKEKYSAPELRRWAAVVRKFRPAPSDVYVYFRHEETGSGPKFARQLGSLLTRE